MQKSKITPEDWILITLMNASERTGVSLNDWYFLKRPDGIEIEPNHFYQIIKKMEDQGIIKKASFIGGNYCLSDKGKKEAIKLKKRLNYDDYYFIISKFPEIELKERVKGLEAFIITLCWLFILFSLSKLLTPSYVSNPDLLIALILIYIFILVLLSYYFVLSFAKIWFYWIIGVQRDTLWLFKDWLWNNQNRILYLIPAFVIFLIIYGIYILNIVSWQIMIWGIVMLVISQIIVNYKKIVSFIQPKFEKYFKPP